MTQLLGERLMQKDARTTKVSMYAKTAPMFQRSDELYNKAEALSLRASDLTTKLVELVDSSGPGPDRTTVVAAIVTLFSRQGLFVGDGLAVVQETVKWVVAVPITVGVAPPSAPAAGEILPAMSDPVAQRLNQARDGRIYQLGSEDDLSPFSEALIEVFHLSGLSVRDAVMVLAQVEAALLHSAVV